MTKYLRTSASVAVEIIETDLPLADLYHPDLVASMIAAPAEAGLGWIWDGTAWAAPVAPDLAVVRAARIEALRRACAAAIVGGLTVDALGAPHLYPTDETAQRNLGGLVTRSILSADGWTCQFAAADASGVWAYRTHSGAQIRAVGTAVADHIEAAMIAFDALRSAVEAAPDAAAVGAITWP